MRRWPWALGLVLLVVGAVAAAAVAVPAGVLAWPDQADSGNANIAEVEVEVPANSSVAAGADVAATTDEPTTTVQPTTAVPSTSDPTGRAEVASRQLPRIKADGSRLYDSVTGRTFTPRGTNYTRLARTSDGIVYHSTFEPGVYNPAAVDALFAQLQHDGYNTVRVFIDPGSGTTPHGMGRGSGTRDLAYGPYMDNVAAFVRSAARHGIYVMPSLDFFPNNDYYWGFWGRVGTTPNVGGRNKSYMDKGAVATKVEYVKQFVSALLDRLGIENASAILAYQSDNEVYFEANKPPYDRLSGTVTPHNGLTYDMSKPVDRQQAADASLVVYSHRVKAALATVDPDALLAIGFFTNLAVGKSGFNGLMTYCSTDCRPGVDYRVPGRALSVSIHGTADFIDLHLYPRNDGGTFLTQALNSMEIGRFRKPYIIGEIGARKSFFNNDVIVAALAMRDAQIATCPLGARGWLFFAWDTREDLASLPLFFQMTDTRGAINGQLAPIVRPNPCALRPS